jgi:hypothetical protein
MPVCALKKNPQSSLRVSPGSFAPTLTCTRSVSQKESEKGSQQQAVTGQVEAARRQPAEPANGGF